MLIEEFNVKIESKKKLKEDTYLFGFRIPNIAKNAIPGQFLHIKIDDSLTILRRPFSIHRVIKDIVYILFRIKGKGTRLLSNLKINDTLNIIGPLGNGFFYKEENLKSILVAGGMGVAPLFFLAEELKKYNSKENMVLLGAKNKEDILLENEFKKLGYNTYITTEDGSFGEKGKVTELLKKLLIDKENLNIYACGPYDMFFEIYRIIKQYKNINCYVSVEQFMGCGLGFCYSCIINTKYGYKKICKDGPVFNLKDLIF